MIKASCTEPSGKVSASRLFLLAVGGAVLLLFLSVGIRLHFDADIYSAFDSFFDRAEMLVFGAGLPYLSNQIRRMWTERE